MYHTCMQRSCMHLHTCMYRTGQLISCTLHANTACWMVHAIICTIIGACIPVINDLTDHHCQVATYAARCTWRGSTGDGTDDGAHRPSVPTPMPPVRPAGAERRAAVRGDPATCGSGATVGGVWRSNGGAGAVIDACGAFSSGRA